MPSYTIHEELYYIIQAENAHEAISTFEANRGRPQSSMFYIPVAGREVYVTDENGEDMGL